MQAQDDDFLLGLYRAAREEGPEQFQDLLMDRVQKRLGSASAFWLDARLAPEATLVPTRMRVRNIDPDFLVDWAELNPRDPSVAVALANRGQAFRVHVPSFYAAVPDQAELLRHYEIQSMTVLLVAGARSPAVQGIGLYQRDADALCPDADKRWLEGTMPHLCEALRVNAAVHAPATQRLDDGDGAVAVADASNGGLIRADAGFLAVLAREWSGFDGRRLPLRLVRAWQSSPTFAHLGQRVRIEGRRCGSLVYLTAREAASAALTPRQLEVAKLYAAGLSSKQIAQRCNLAPATVRTHLAAVYGIFGVHGKIEMAQHLARLLDSGGSRLRPASVESGPGA